MRLMEAWLENVAEHGWSTQSREEFVRFYDREIGEAIISLLVEYGLLTDRRALRSLKSYVESRLQDKRAGPEHPLWEIIEEGYMRVYSEVFQKKLIENYVSGVQAGAIKADFMDYLRGAVRRRFLDVLGAGGKSEKELFDAIVDSKKPETIHQHIAEAKGRYGEKARSYLLCSGFQGGHLRAHVDFFFERFITERYPALRSSLRPGDSALLKLLDAFVTERCTANPMDEQITRYIGRVSPTVPRHKIQVELAKTDTDAKPESDEEALERAGAISVTKDMAQPERLYWWDRLLRCRLPNDSELTELRRLTLTLEDEALRDTKLCLACVQLKTESTLDQKDDLRMFLVYYLSNYGAAPEPAAQREELARETLCLEHIRGRTLSWEQIYKAFGHECNPTRVKSRIREKFEALQGSLP